MSPALLHSCVQSGSTSVLIAGNLVTLYIPANSRQDGVMGVHRTALDGQTVVSAGTILTSNDVIACASNWVTGEVVCVSGGTDVYLIQGNTLTATLTDGANGGDFQSSGGFGTVGVTVDASTNTATLALGTKVNGIDQGGYQVLDLGTNTFGAVVGIAIGPAYHFEAFGTRRTIEVASWASSPAIASNTSAQSSAERPNGPT